MCPQVLDLPGSAVVSSPAPPERENSAYKAAVDHFNRSNSNSPAPADLDHKSLAEVQESDTQRLQQLMLSAKTLTARQDLVDTLRSERGVCSHFLSAGVDTFRTHADRMSITVDSPRLCCAIFLKAASAGAHSANQWLQ